MSYFVLIYDRVLQELKELREFPEDALADAQAYRLAAQHRSLRDSLDQDIVLFQAASREALKRTHGSYFLSERELLERTKRVVEATS